MSAGVKPFEEIPVVDLPDDYRTRTGGFLAEMYRTHGPIFRLNEFGVDVVYLVGPEANRFVLLSDRLKFSHHLGWGEFFGVERMFGDGLLTMDGAEHAHRDAKEKGKKKTCHSQLERRRQALHKVDQDGPSGRRALA